MDIGKTNERLSEKAAIDLQVVVNEATEWIEVGLLIFCGGKSLTNVLFDV